MKLLIVQLYPSMYRHILKLMPTYISHELQIIKHDEHLILSSNRKFPARVSATRALSGRVIWRLPCSPISRSLNCLVYFTL
jgi:hypothetical protein